MISFKLETNVEELEHLPSICTGSDQDIVCDCFVFSVSKIEAPLMSLMALTISKSFLFSTEKLASGFTVITNSSLATAKYLLSTIHMQGSTLRDELVGNKSFFSGVSLDICGASVVKRLWFKKRATTHVIDHVFSAEPNANIVQGPRQHLWNVFQLNILGEFQ